jgi:NitT/TauT family transport system permease protein
MSDWSVALPPGAAPAPGPYQLPPRLGMWQKALRNPLTLITDPPHLGISVLTMALLFVAWEFVVYLLNIKPVLLPAPSQVLEALASYAAGNLLRDLKASAFRILLGLAAGAGAGVALGLAMGWYPRLRALVSPHIALTFPVPKSALISLMIIWFGTGDPYKVILVAVGVFYIMLTNTITGVESIPAVTILAARNLGARDRDIFWKVILPGSLPVILAALRISFSVSLILAIFGEMVVSPDGLGHFIANAGQLLETEKVFAGLIVSGIVGVIGYQVIDWVERRLMPWRRSRHQHL